MTNQGENKNKNPINTRVSSILLIARLIYYGRGGVEQNGKMVHF